MNDAFTQLCDTDLRTLVAGLRSQRISPPFSEMQVSRVLSGGLAKSVATALAKFHAIGFDSEQIVVALDLLLSDRQNSTSDNPQIDLVTSGPEAPGITNRDTSVVVRELFAHARFSVIVVGYAVHQGQRVFQALAQRMEEVPDLESQFYLNISRPDRDTTASEILVSRFAHRFKENQWPLGCRLPEVYYDPRSVSDIEPIRSSLHAKCVIVDGEHVFVSSANFTEAGQDRNIEVGLNIHSKWLAERLSRHFQSLRDRGLVVRAF